MKCPQCGSRVTKEGASMGTRVAWALACMNRRECGWVRHLPPEESDADMDAIQMLLKATVPPDWGFVFIAATPEKKDHPYMSNLDRHQAVELLRHTANELEEVG